MRGEVVAVVVLALAALIVTPVGPARVGYVYSSSMSPTIEANEGFVIVSAGEIQPGDIITYRSPRQDVFVTHRVVERTPEGFITKGDANPSTDQATGAPPVKRSQVVGEVLTIGGSPVTVPFIGRIAAFAGSNRFVLLIAGVAAALSSYRPTFSSFSRRRHENAPMRIGSVLTLTLVLLPAALIGMMVSATSVHTATFQAQPGDAPEDGVVSTDQATTESLTFALSGDSHAAVQASGMQVLEQSQSGNTLTVRVRIPPAETTGSVRKRVRVYTYPDLLPDPTARALDRRHPALGAVTTVLAGFIPLQLAAYGLLDRKQRLRFRNRSLHELFT